MRFLFFVAVFFGLMASKVVFAQGKPTGDVERLLNEKPDYHQFEGEIVEVIDADTIRVKVHLLPGLSYEVNVRSKGVDAPELRTKCDVEKALAVQVRQKVARSFPAGEWVYIENIETDSCGGRIVADIKQRHGNQRWRTLTKFLLDREEKWAVPFKRGSSFDWCKELKKNG